MSSKKGFKKNTGNAAEIFSEKLNSLNIDTNVSPSHGNLPTNETTNVITNTKKSILSLNIMKYLPIITIIAVLLIWWYFEKSMYKIQMGISSSNKKYENKIESIDQQLSKLVHQNTSVDDNLIHQERILNLIKNLENENTNENKQQTKNETIIITPLSSELQVNNLQKPQDISHNIPTNTITQEKKQSPVPVVEPKVQLQLQPVSPSVAVDVAVNSYEDQNVVTSNENKVRELPLVNQSDKLNNNIIAEKNGKQLTLGAHLSSVNNMKHVDQLVSPRIIEMS